MTATPLSAADEARYRAMLTEEQARAHMDRASLLRAVEGFRATLDAERQARADERRRLREAVRELHEAVHESHMRFVASKDWSLADKADGREGALDDVRALLADDPELERIADDNGDELEHGEPDFPGQFPESGA